MIDTLGGLDTIKYLNADNSIVNRKIEQSIFKYDSLIGFGEASYKNSPVPYWIFMRFKYKKYPKIRITMSHEFVENAY